MREFSCWTHSTRTRRCWGTNCQSCHRAPRPQVNILELYFFLFCFSVLKSSHSRGGNERIRLTQSRISLKNSLLTGTSSRSRQDSEHLWTLDLPHLRKLEWSKPKSDGLDTLQILLDDMFRHDSLEASGKKTWNCCSLPPAGMSVTGTFTTVLVLNIFWMFLHV